MIDDNYKVNKFVFELVDSVVKAKTKEEKVNLLKSMDQEWALKDLLKGTYDDKIQWIIPTGQPPYEPSRPESTPSNLKKKYKDFAYFAKNGPGMKMPSFKREKIFLSLLESIHPEDAKLVIGMINKQSIKGLTKKTVEEAFPGWVS